MFNYIDTKIFNQIIPFFTTEYSRFLDRIELQDCYLNIHSILVYLERNGQVIVNSKHLVVTTFLAKRIIFYIRKQK